MKRKDSLLQGYYYSKLPKSNKLLNSYGPGGATTDGCRPGYYKHSLLGCIPIPGFQPVQKEQAQLKKSTPIAKGKGYGQKVDPYERIIAQETAEKQAEYYSDLAKRASISAALAAGVVTGGAALPYLAPALEAPLLGTLGAEYGTGALTAGNLINAGLFYRGAKNLPNAGESIRIAYNNPTWKNISNAAAETAITGLDMLPFGMSAAKGIPSVIQDVNQAGNYLTTQTPLKNTYKINPWANKVDPNLLIEDPAALYRGIGKSGKENLLQSKILTSADIKSFPEPYFVKGSPPGAYGQGYIAEVKNEPNTFKGFGLNNEEIFTTKPVNLENPNLKIYQSTPKGYRELSKTTGLPIQQKPNWLRGYKKVPKPTSAYEDYFKNIQANDKRLQNLLSSKKISYEDYLKQQDLYKKELHKSLGLGEELGSGTYGSVFKLANDPSKVVKLGRPYGNRWTPELIESLKSINQNANIAIPEKVQYFEIPSVWKGYKPTTQEVVTMPNLNETTAEKLNLNKRDRYAYFLKQVRQLRDKGVAVDVANPENFKFNQFKNIFDIYDVNPRNIDNPAAYMRYVKDKTQKRLLDNMMYKKGGMIKNIYGPGGQTTDGCPAGYNKHPITGECMPNGWVAPMQAGPTVQNAERLRRAAALNRGTTGPTIGQSRSDEPWRQRQAAEMRRQNAQESSALAQTMGSFTPSGYNPAAGVTGAETFVNMNPLITGPIMSTSRLYGAGRSMVDPNTYNPYFSSDKGVVSNILGGLNLAGDVGMLGMTLRNPTGSFNPRVRIASKTKPSDFTERNIRVKQAWADAKKKKAGIPTTAEEYRKFIQDEKLKQQAGDVLREKGMMPDPRTGGSYQAPADNLTWKDPKTGEIIYQLDAEDYGNFKTPELYREAQQDFRSYKRKYLQDLANQRNAAVNEAKQLGIFGKQFPYDPNDFSKTNLLGGKFPGFDIPDYIENLGFDYPMYYKDFTGATHNISGIDPSELIPYKGLKVTKGLSPNKYGGLVKHQIKGQVQPTSADSAALYNNTMALLNYYGNKKKYKNLGISPVLYDVTKTNMDAVKDMKERLKNRKKHPFTARRWNSNLNVAGSLIGGLLGADIETDQLDPDYDFKMSDYYQRLSPYQYKQRETANNILDTDAPMGLYDTRIKPTREYNYLNIDDRSGPIAGTNPLYGDIVSFYGYDPALIKPWNMLTDKEKALRSGKPNQSSITIVNKKSNPVPNKPQISNSKTTSSKIIQKTQPKKTIPLKPFTGVIEQPQPGLKRKVLTVEPISTQSSSLSLKLPNIPNIQMSGSVPQGKYRVEYYDPELKQETHRNFMTQAESDAFTNELSKRNLSGVPSAGNITQRVQYRDGGLVKYQKKGEVKKSPITHYVFAEQVPDNAFETEANNLKTFISKNYPGENVVILPGRGDDYFNKTVLPTLGKVGKQDRVYLFGHHGSRYAGVPVSLWGNAFEQAQKRAGDFNCYLGSCGASDLAGTNPDNWSIGNIDPAFSRLKNFYYRPDQGNNPFPDASWLGVNPNAEAVPGASNLGVLNAMYTRSNYNLNAEKIHKNRRNYAANILENDKELILLNEQHSQLFNQLLKDQENKNIEKLLTENNEKRSKRYNEINASLEKDKRYKELLKQEEKSKTPYITKSPRYSVDFAKSTFNPYINIDQRQQYLDKRKKEEQGVDSGALFNWFPTFAQGGQRFYGVPRFDEGGVPDPTCPPGKEWNAELKRCIPILTEITDDMLQPGWEKPTTVAATPVNEVVKSPKFDLSQYKDFCDAGYYKDENGNCVKYKTIEEIRAESGVISNDPVDESLTQGSINSNSFLRNWYRRRAKDPRFTKIANARHKVVDKIGIIPISKQQQKEKQASAWYTPIPGNKNISLNINDPRSRGASTQVHEKRHALDTLVPQPNQNTIITNIIGKNKTAPGYSKSLTIAEVPSRLDQFRRRYNIDPNKKYTREEMRKIIDYHRHHSRPASQLDEEIQSGDSDIDVLLDLIGDDPEKLLQLNDQLVKSQQSIGADMARWGGSLKKRFQGGMIEDDMGQLKYPGFPTRIRSKNITMEGVNHPLVAKTNRGITKLLLPNMKYEFEPMTQFVDEHPVPMIPQISNQTPRVMRNFGGEEPPQYINLSLPKMDQKRKKVEINPYIYYERPNPFVNVMGAGFQGNARLNNRWDLTGGMNVGRVNIPTENFSQYLKPNYNIGLGYRFSKGGQHGGLDRWFAEKWVDVKTGKACGRQEGENRAYPACRPSKRVSSQTPKTSSEMSSSEKAKFKSVKQSSQRIPYNHKRR